MTADVHAARFDGVESALQRRWPESRLEPSLDRIRLLTDLLGVPQRSFSTVHVTGTNGKTSTARILERVLAAHGRRTGRFTSPHLESVTERIAIDGAPIDPECFVRAYDLVASAADRVDTELGRLSFFEMLVAVAYVAFAQASVDTAVVEVGMGGSWDATNVVDGQVAVILPVGMDHADHLGDTPERIAHEKAGIIKAGAHVVVAAQDAEVRAVLQVRVSQMGATASWEGRDFGVVGRTPTPAGQVVSLEGLHGRYDDLLLPLRGAHQAQNAAVALAAAEATLRRPLDDRAVRVALAAVTSPGRLELVGGDPPVFLDAAHNPHGAAAVALSFAEILPGAPMVGVLGLMADKDAAGVLERLEPHLAHVVCTAAEADRALPAADLGVFARNVLGAARVTVTPSLASALDEAIAMSQEGRGGGVFVTGSVHLVGQARMLLHPGRAHAG